MLQLKDERTAAEWENELKAIAKKCRVDAKVIKQVEKMLVIEHSRTKRERYRKVVGEITIEYLEQKYGVPLEKLKNTIIAAAAKRGTTATIVVQSKLAQLKPPSPQLKLNL